MIKTITFYPVRGEDGLKEDQRKLKPDTITKRGGLLKYAYYVDRDTLSPWRGLFNKRMVTDTIKPKVIKRKYPRKPHSNPKQI